MDLLTYSQQMLHGAIDGETRGIWYWASLYALIVCACSLQFQLRTRSWPFARGKLDRLEIENFGASEPVTSNRTYAGRASYSYVVDGTTYRGSRISPWIFVVSHNVRLLLGRQLGAVRQDPDGGVKVYYNPANPRKSYLIVAGKTGMTITLLLGCLPILLYWMKYH